MKKPTALPFKSYAILGSGRLARHFSFYLKSLGLPVLQWSRNGAPEFNSFSDPDEKMRLEKALVGSSHILLAVKDSAISELSRRTDSSHQAVHFSGALNVAGVPAAHPLMSFGEPLESKDWYRCIPFVVSEGFELRDLLPGLSNPSYSLSADLRPYYHALCSLAGNGSFLLWKQIGEEFEKTLHLPKQLLSPFLHQVVNNANLSALTGFTGPVARGDWDVIRAHLDCLHSQPALASFYKAYLQLAKNLGHLIPEDLR